MLVLRKKILRAFCLMFLFGTFFVTGFQVSAASNDTIIGTNVNIRSKPTTSASLITTVTNKKVVVTGKLGDWSKVSVGNINGWVKSEFLLSQSKSKEVEKKTASIAIENQSSYGLVNGTSVNVRASSNTNSKIIAKLSDTRVKILASSGDWYKIDYIGTVGWVKKDFVSTSTAATTNKTVSSTSSSTGTVNGKNINIRSKPSKEGKIVASLTNKKVNVLSASGDWYKISTGNTTGWVKKNFVSTSYKSSSVASTGKSGATTAQYATITKSNVNIRSKPSKTAKVIANLSKKQVKVLAKSGTWYKVSYGNTTGWIAGEMLSISSNGSYAKATSKQISKRNQLIAYSRGFLGRRYVYGGNGPNSFDCSGFTSYVYKKFGIRLERTATAQSKQGKYVSRKNLQPGDLVFFKTDNSKKQITHTGIYIGNNKFIHASSGKSKRKVTINGLNESFYNKAYVTARTFI